MESTIFSFNHMCQVAKEGQALGRMLASGQSDIYQELMTMDYEAGVMPLDANPFDVDEDGVWQGGLTND